MAVEDPTCPIIKNLVLLDSEGKRIAVKYYSGEWPNISAQANFEKLLWSKTSRTNARQEAEIVMFDTFIVVYKYVGDLMFYATGSQDENELILYTVLQAFYESVSILLRQQVEKKTVLENLDLVLLCMDEIIDGGVILETEPQTIASRVTMRGAEGEGALPEQAAVQSFSKALASAKEHLTRSLLK
ncbi:zeta-cop, subunit of COP-I complex [Haematococcus lacustris]